jgi:hypothetical protein
MDQCKCVGILLFLAIYSSYAFEKELEKSKLLGHDKHDVNIFIEKRIHFIHAKIDLKPSLLGILSLKRHISQLKNGSPGTLEFSLGRNLDGRVNTLVRKLERIVGKKDKRLIGKRSIDFIGNLISDLFGNPGPEDWKKVNSNILALEEALKRLNENSEDNHADIDMNRHFIEKHNTELRAITQAVNQNQRDIVNVKEDVVSLELFFEASAMADIIEVLLSALIEIQIDGNKGFCSDRALDKDFLLDNLHSLEANNVGLAPIFGSWEWRKFYKYELCSIALETDSVWVTLRIPLVRKSENLIRIIPPPRIKGIIDRIDSYGVQTVLFKERDNDNYHLMTKSAYEMCSVLGNTKTCDVRDAKFRVVKDTLIPVEFALNRFLFVGKSNKTVTFLGICPEGIKEISIVSDFVLTAPKNCSYKTADILIDIKETNSAISSLLGISNIDMFEIRKIDNVARNLSELEIGDIAISHTNNHFKTKTKEIDQRLETINTNHDNLWTRVNFDKYIVFGILTSLILLYVSVKLGLLLRKKRNSRNKKNSEIDIPMQNLELKKLGQEEEIHLVDHQKSGSMDFKLKDINFSSRETQF